MKHRALALGAALLLLGLMPGATLAAPASNLDQSNAMVPGYTVGSTADLAQTFTAGKSGRLSGVDLWLGGSGTIGVAIKATASGLPAGADLATASGAAANPDGWVHFSFPTPPVVTSGTQYAIVFNTGTMAAVYGSPNNYVGGQALMASPGWAPITDRPDWAFQTYVDTVTTVAQWDKASITAGATTPLTLTVTMTFRNGVEAKSYEVMVQGLPSWYTPQSATCSSLGGADVAAVCTIANLRINGLDVTAPATGDTLTVILTGTAAPTLYDVGYPGVASTQAWILYPNDLYIEGVGGATVQVVAPAAATPTPPPGATPTPPPAATPTPTPTQAVTLPPTSAGVGSGSDGTGSTIWLLPVGLLAFLGGAFALVIRRRRLA